MRDKDLAGSLRLLRDVFENAPKSRVHFDVAIGICEGKTQVNVCSIAKARAYFYELSLAMSKKASLSSGAKKSALYAATVTAAKASKALHQSFEQKIWGFNN